VVVCDRVDVGSLVLVKIWMDILVRSRFCSECPIHWFYSTDCFFLFRCRRVLLDLVFTVTVLDLCDFDLRILAGSRSGRCRSPVSTESG
jgi:hypothetical protein